MDNGLRKGGGGRQLSKKLIALLIILFVLGVNLGITLIKQKKQLKGVSWNIRDYLGVFLPQEKYEEVQSRILKIEEGTLVSLNNRDGEIKVVGGEEENLKLKTTKVVYARSKSQAKEYAQRIEVKVTEGDKALKIKTTGPEHKPSYLRWSVHYELSLPPRCPIKITNTNGGLSLSSLNTKVEMRTTNGGITLDNVKGKIEGRATNGSLKLSKIGGKINLGTTNGKIEMEAGIIKEGEYELSTTNGGITLSILPESSVRIKVGTTNGKVSSNLKLKDRKESRRFEMLTGLEGRLGDGEAKLELRTTNGGIKIGSGV